MEPAPVTFDVEGEAVVSIALSRKPDMALPALGDDCESSSSGIVIVGVLVSAFGTYAHRAAGYSVNALKAN